MVQLVTAGHWSFSAAYYKRQLVLDYLLATYKKPLVVLIHGIVMGGGAGLSMHGSFRVVTENTVFAMPEASIGHFPDVGASYFLSRLPGYYGEYLGLTGARIDGAEMVACGLATHFVLSKDLQSIENDLLAVPSSDTATIYEYIKKYINQARLNHDSYRKRLEIVNVCFSKKTVEEILLSLENEVSRGADKWVAKAISSMKSASPTSLKIFLRSVRVTTNASFISKNGDFFEWQPSRLEQVTEEMVEQAFSKVEDDEWVEFEPKDTRNLMNMQKPRL
ncbi:hypothetical protein RJ639_022287 [Escallonia herrerae]|uniref:3-hydroxyisobutyryl-CoA hydrolase n=1 Tax=Escallonia herrerae TaxID=1293975 RepID=A0AA88V3E8_9ASTE|nr:hypothetical protein RJ639_022287 [Escallonia herrerae]